MSYLCAAFLYHFRPFPAWSTEGKGVKPGYMGLDVTPSRSEKSNISFSITVAWVSGYLQMKTWFIYPGTGDGIVVDSTLKHKNHCYHHTLPNLILTTHLYLTLRKGVRLSLFRFCSKHTTTYLLYLNPYMLLSKYYTHLTPIYEIRKKKETFLLLPRSASLTQTTHN